MVINVNWIEADPLPLECLCCHEEECCNCDYAGKRRYFPKAEEPHLKRKNPVHSAEQNAREEVPSADREHLER